MWDRIRPFIAPAFGLVMFSVALAVLHHTLREYHYRDIVAAINEIPRRQLIAAFFCAVCSYAFLTLHDALAFRYVGRSLPYPRIAFASFIGFSISNSVGYSFLSGGSVRYRLYSSWNLSAADITRIVVFCTLTGWLGSGVLAGAALVIEPGLLATASNISPNILRAGGVMILLAISAYIAACGMRFGVFRRGDWEFWLPSFRLACTQVAVSAVDHALIAATLYMLLPSTTTISFPAFAVVWVLAIAGGAISQVPGGAGVFETLVITLLATKTAPTDAMAALIAYRFIYYFGPLLTGAALIIAHEVHRRRVAAQRFIGSIDPWLSPVVPQVLAFTTMLNGAILLFSGATPSAHARMEVLRDLLPLPVVELSHFLASLVGALLVMLARSIQRRVDAAFIATLALLFAGGLFSLLKGIDYEEAAISFALLAILAPCRRYFYRKASLFEERYSPRWLFAVLLVFCSVAWLTDFSYEHVDYSQDLWWQFSFRGDVHRSVRAISGILGLTLLFGAAHLLRPAKPEPHAVTSADLDTAEQIVKTSPSTMSALALLGDKTLLFNEQRTAFIMYRTEGRSWIALGEPVGPAEEWVELIWRFREMSDRHSGWTVFYQVPANSLHYYFDLGLAPLKLGEEARVDLTTFTLDSGARKSERNLLHKLEKDGVTFEIVSREYVAGLLPDMRAVSESCMAERHTREKGFSVGYFDEPYLARFPHAIVRVNGKVIAFANVIAGANKEEASIDLMRFERDTVPSVMDFLLIHLLLWTKDQGYRWFNLGMAPLSGLEDRPLAPVWNRLSALVYRHGEHFYNFQGLRKYKDKFGPQWQPRYLVSPGGMALPTILRNLTAVISRGLAGTVHK